MLETILKDPRDHKIAELERELAVFHGFTISHMLASNTRRLVTFSPLQYKDAHKVVLVLKRETIDEKTALIAELVVKETKDH